MHVNILYQDWGPAAGFNEFVAEGKAARLLLFDLNKNYI